MGKGKEVPITTIVLASGHKEGEGKRDPSYSIYNYFEKGGSRGGEGRGKGGEKGKSFNSKS